MNKEYYINQIEKEASLASAVVGAAKNILPTVAKGAKAFGAMGAGQRMAIGAGAGALKNGLTYNGDDGMAGRVKSMVGGAANGAMLGGALSNKAMSSTGKMIAGFGDDLKNVGGKIGFNNTANNIGTPMNNVGTKINNYFGN